MALAVPAVSPATEGGFDGVSVLQTPSVAEFQTMGRGGVDIVRLPVFWEQVESIPGSPRDWSRYDALYSATAASGLEVLPLLDSSPRWLYANQRRPPLERIEHLQAWTRFVYDFAARYGPGGAFWTARPGLPYLPLRHYQVWNEPNIKFSWGGKPNPRQYMRLFSATRDAVLLAAPGAQAITGGLFHEPRRGTGISANKFVQRLYRQPGSRAEIDAIGLHPYAGKPKEVIENIAGTRRVMNRKKDRAGRIWVTEFGWSVSGLGHKFSPVRATVGQQARRLKRTYRLLRKRGDLRVDRAFWFSWRDFDSDPNAQEFWIYRMGLFDLSGNPRPAWNAYASVAGGTP